MDGILIHSVNQFYPKDSDIKKLIKYIAGKSKGKEKVRYYNGRGLDKKPKKAAEELVKVQKFYKKDSKRRVYQFIVSFPQKVEDTAFVRIVAENIANMFFDKRHQVYYGVHEDTDNLHIHFVVNAVNYETGRKWHQSKREFNYMKNDILQIIKALY